MSEAVLTCRRSRFLIHSSLPSVWVMSADSSGLQKASHRRGVTPLVLFWNFSGKIFTKSCNTARKSVSTDEDRCGRRRQHAFHSNEQCLAQAYAQ